MQEYLLICATQKCEECVNHKKYIISFIHGDKKKHNTKKYTHYLKQINKRQQNKTTIDHQQQHIYISIDKFPRLYFGIAYF